MKQKIRAIERPTVKFTPEFRFRNGMVEIVALVGCCVAKVGDRLRTFLDDISALSSKVKKVQEKNGRLALEDTTHMLFQNGRNQLSS